MSGTLAAVALTGCGVFDEPQPQPEPTPDPLQPLLDETLALVTAYDRAVVDRPALSARLAPLAGDHRAHADALARMIGAASPAPAPSTSAAATVGDPLVSLRAAEKAAHTNAATACRQAPAERAALLGSIAACRATHLEALR